MKRPVIWCLAAALCLCKGALQYGTVEDSFVVLVRLWQDWGRDTTV